MYVMFSHPMERIKGVSRTVSFAFLAAALTISFAGCGGGGEPPPAATTSVTGTVTWKGEKLKEGTVQFHPQGLEKSHPAIGEIGENGIFTLTTFDQSDGAVLGNHIVTVQIFPKGANPGFESEAPGYVPIPQRYTDPTTSDLLFEVKPGTNTADLVLADE